MQAISLDYFLIFKYLEILDLKIFIIDLDYQKFQYCPYY